MATEFGVQTFVHKLEEGSWAKWVWFALLLAGLAFVSYRFLYTDSSPGSFRGLSNAHGMEQAQIAREIARGNGFSTKLIRPIAIKQFEDNKHSFPSGNIPDTYHAPLNPFINSFILRLSKSHWQMTKRDIVYTCDRVIAGTSMLFFLLSVAVSYATAKRLFDRRLAVLGMGLVLASNTFWQFSMSGLPQMLMLLIFSGGAYALVRAVELESWRQVAKEEAQIPVTAQGGVDTESKPVPPPQSRFPLLRKPVFWLVLAAFFFGLLALTHGLTAWIFAGVLLFCAVYFRPKKGGGVAGIFGNPAVLMFVVFALVYAPWMVRNQKVCGSPFGIAPFSGIYQIRGTESEIMRTQKLTFGGLNPINFRMKLIRQTMDQFGNIYNYFGSILVAPLFFLALLHIFKGPVSSAFRWCLLLMWLFALFGMSAFGLQSSYLDSNDLHILFAPLMTFYGMALVLTMWTRLEINVSLVRRGFLTLIYVITILPLVNTLFGKLEGRVQWPPYFPPYIAVLGEWVGGPERPDEIICSDMPWGVAWYADRRSLWLPMTPTEFAQLNDNNTLHGRIVGLYLTPVTGNAPFISEIMKGEYKDWSPWIMRNARILELDFPLHAITGLPVENECVFYCDRDRWNTRTD